MATNRNYSKKSSVTKMADGGSLRDKMSMKIGDAVDGAKSLVDKFSRKPPPGYTPATIEKKSSDSSSGSLLDGATKGLDGGSGGTLQRRLKDAGAD
jgi:hypothetical protein